MLRKQGHLHVWEEVQRYFSPGTVQIKAKGMTHHQLLEIMHGFTVIELRCTVCGNIKSERLLGDATNK